MGEANESKQKVNILPERAYFGRRVIYSSEDAITKENVLSAIEKAFTKHLLNRSEIDYLYNYYKGKQPSLYREKEIRSDICNRIVENRANQIVTFKVGYLCGSPIQYVSNQSADGVSADIDRLNKYLDAEGKATKDKSLFEWGMICGTSFRLILPVKNEVEGDAPFEITTLDPRNTFVIYSNDVRHRPLAGVYYTTDESNLVRTFSVYTETEYFEIEDIKLVKSEPHALGAIPIIEYPANEARLGSFEVVMPLLDAINTIDCNRVDGIEQFIQSLVILTNCTLPEGTTATELQRKGLIELKSVGDNKADIKILSEQLNQSETQTLKRDMYQTVLEIVGMPSQGDGSTGDSSNNGAISMKNGWETAEARAKDSELMFKQSERGFIKQLLRICRDLTDIDIASMDIDIHFTRRNYENLLSKTQVLTMLLATEKVEPKLAFQASGLFVDSEEAYRMSKAYVEELSSKGEVANEDADAVGRIGDTESQPNSESQPADA